MNSKSIYILLFILSAVTTLYFGIPEKFDRYFLLLVAAAAVVSFNLDKNIFTLLLLLVIEHLFEELVWLYRHSNLYIEWLLIFAGLILSWLVREERVAKIAIATLTCVAVSEIYWFYINYDSPELGWASYLAGQILFIKRMILLRAHCVGRIVRPWYDQIRIVAADSRLEKVYSARGYLQIALISEYLIRHHLDASITIVWMSYSYIAHAIALYILILIAFEVLQTFRTRFLQA